MYITLIGLRNGFSEVCVGDGCWFRCRVLSSSLLVVDLGVLALSSALLSQCRSWVVMWVPGFALLLLCLFLLRI